MSEANKQLWVMEMTPFEDIFLHLSWLHHDDRYWGTYKLKSHTLACKSSSSLNRL